MGTYFPLILRPATLFWILLIGFLNIVLASQPEPRAWLIWSLPFSLGLMVSGPMHDLTCREFSWTLPKLRVKLFTAFIELGLVVAVCSAFFSPTPMPLWMEMLYAFTIFSVMLGLDDPGQAITRLRPVKSVVTWIALPIIGMAHLSIMAWLADHPFVGSLSLLAVIAAYFAVTWLPRALRHRVFEPYLSMANAFNTAANVNYRARLKPATRTRHALWRSRPSRNQMSSLIAASFFEAFGATRIGSLMLGYTATVLVMIVVYGLINSWINPPFHMFFVGATCSLAFNRPMMLKGTPLVPLDRGTMLTAAYASALLENAVYVFVPGMLCLIMGGLPIAPIHVGGSWFATLSFPETAGQTILLGAAFLPFIQWTRRKFGYDISAIFLCLVPVIGVSALVLGFLNSNTYDMLNLSPWIPLVLAFITGQALFFLGIRQIFKKSDLTGVMT